MINYCPICSTKVKQRENQVMVRGDRYHFMCWTNDYFSKILDDIDGKKRRKQKRKK